MQRISITNPQNVIDGTAKKYYFKLRNTGGPKGDKGDKGDTGQTGPQGPKGDAATVAVGSTTTLAVGQDATVENVGSIYNAVLNFGIPQGPQGPQGAKGDKGDTGAQGETGPRGPQGERGTNATVYIGTTSTLNPGSQATVYNSGTDSNAVLNFGIPKGEKGDTGPMPTIAQTTGQAIDQVMSQKATTDTLNTKQATISSSNKLSADLVDDTSTTNKFVTAEDKTTWNAKQDALTAGNNIDIEDGVISTPAIAPEVVAELPETGAEGKLYLTPKNYTRGTGTGNPITATVAEDAGKMESFKLDGDTFQQSYEGKNLLSLNHLILGENNNGEFSIDDTEASRWRTLSTDFAIAPIPSGTRLTMSVRETGGEANGFGYYVRLIASDGTYQDFSVYLATGSTIGYNTGTITTSFEVVKFRMVLDANTSESKTANLSVQWQIEKGSTATSYEPYVGGTPSPNPDYPQPIQTVTGEQTVTINGTGYPINLGKNLFDGSIYKTDYILSATGSEVFSERAAITEPIKIEPNTTYTASALWHSGGGDTYIRIGVYDGSMGWIVRYSGQLNKITFTTPANAGYIRLSYYSSRTDSVQLELGATATTYAPYKTPIELCKLGTYQDYIWKDGDSWKVHKATGYGKRLVNIAGIDGYSSVYGTATTSNGAFSIINTNWGSDYATTAGIAIASSVIGVYQSQNIDGNNTANSMADGTFCQRSGTNDRVYFRFASWARSKTVNEVNQMITDNGGVDLWYPLATPTDTTITDTDLIAQLEAIRTASLGNGTNTISNTATGSNLAGDMEIGYYGYNPTNRYDKWLWLDLNNEYEQIGS